MKNRLRRGHPDGFHPRHLEEVIDFPWHLGYGHGFLGWSLMGFTPEQFAKLHRLDHENDLSGHSPSFRKLERAARECQTPVLDS